MSFLIALRRRESNSTELKTLLGFVDALTEKEALRVFWHCYEVEVTDLEEQLENTGIQFPELPVAIPYDEDSEPLFIPNDEE